MTEKIKEVSSPIVIDCKYYLPCGKCDKTNEFCSLLQSDVTITKKPNITVTTVPNEYSVNPSFYIPVNNNGIEPK